MYQSDAEGVEVLRVPGYKSEAMFKRRGRDDAVHNGQGDAFLLRFRRRRRKMNRVFKQGRGDHLNGLALNAGLAREFGLDFGFDVERDGRGVASGQ